MTESSDETDGGRGPREREPDRRAPASAEAPNQEASEELANKVRAATEHQTATQRNAATAKQLEDRKSRERADEQGREPDSR